jgi:phosphate-selective porin OprO and OprP
VLRPAILAAAAAILISAATPGFGQNTPAAASTVKVGGYTQAQYELIARDGDTTDRVFFRRVMVALDAAPAPHWAARVQADLAPLTSGGNVILKDAYLRYTGLEGRGLTLTIGNQKPPFSRSLYVSSARRGLVERPYTGDRGFGSPGRIIAIKLDGRNAGDRVQWSGALGSALHAPDVDSLRLDSIAEAGADWNQGVVGIGRIEFHPFGATARDWGAFGGPSRIVIGAAAYAWRNDGDHNAYTTAGRATDPSRADLQLARGAELSVGWRGRRVSVDSEYHYVSASTIDETFTGGIYERGDAVLHEWSVEAGLMIVPGTIEMLGSIDALDIAARDPRATRQALGVNWYIVGHALKVSLMERWTSDDRGVRGARLHATYAQAQVAF